MRTGEIVEIAAMKLAKCGQKYEARLIVFAAVFGSGVQIVVATLSVIDNNQRVGVITKDCNVL